MTITHQIETIMAFNISVNQSGQYNGSKGEKGIEVSFNRGYRTTQGQILIVAAFQRKYGLNIKPIMDAWISYFGIK